ncbi:MAG TPA: hypothetical protein VHG69_02080 [Thermoleophilaceae bacterium]|nr:hypothetical protein [Thermoleophilaceae bacterium]
MRARANAAGGYTFIPDIRAFSLGVAAAGGHRIVRTRLAEPAPVVDLAAIVESVLAAHGRPVQALCGVELRSPGPLSPSAFDEFNERYATVLDGLGITLDGTNPVARTNVVPLLREVPTREIHALSFTMPGARDGDYVLAGAAELGDCPTSEARADSVLDQLAARISALGVTGGPAAISVYSGEGASTSLAERIAHRLGHGDLTLTIASPPVSGLIFEMDARRVSSEIAA